MRTSFRFQKDEEKNLESATDFINKHWFNKDYSISSFRKRGNQ